MLDARSVLCFIFTFGNLVPEEKDTIRVKLIGAEGYGGIGMVELLMRHPEASLSALVDVQGVGGKLSDMWPYLRGHCDQTIIAPDSAEAKNIEADVVICATPDGVGQTAPPAEISAGGKVIYYSGDYRFNSKVPSNIFAAIGFLS